jgi:hypothetical protein
MRICKRERATPCFINTVMRVGNRDDRDRGHAAVCIMQLEASGVVVADLKSDGVKPTAVALNLRLRVGTWLLLPLRS